MSYVNIYKNRVYSANNTNIIVMPRSWTTKTTKESKSVCKSEESLFIQAWAWPLSVSHTAIRMEIVQSG